MHNRDILTLMQAKDALAEIEAIKMKIHEEERRITGTAIRFTGMPKGGGAPRGIDDELAALEQLRERRRAAICQYARLAETCEEILAKINPLINRRLARQLYVEQMPVWKAANSIHVSESTAKRMKTEMERLEHF